MCGWRRCWGAVSFGRLQSLLDAAIIAADPDGAEQRAAAAAGERFVRLGRDSEHGLKLIIARATAGDAIWFKATVDRIADILNRQGDHDPVEVRRSKAIGILAQPAEALRLLCDHRDDEWHGSAEPDDLTEGPVEDDGEFVPAAEPSADADAAAHHEPQPIVNPDAAGEAGYGSLRIVAPRFDPARARPRAVVYVHVAAEAVTAGIGICRVEQVGPLLLDRLPALLGDRCTITVKPVIDLPVGHPPVDCYEIPAALREQLLLRHPADVFPYAAAVSRAIDVDHTIPYVDPDEGGPPGQTRIGNLGPQTRYHHRLKTHGRWQIRQPEPGIWLWRSPHHRIYLINSTGTHPLGDTDFAETIWRAADTQTPVLIN
jgi:hypothetical protein